MIGYTKKDILSSVNSFDLLLTEAHFSVGPCSVVGHVPLAECPILKEEWDTGSGSSENRQDQYTRICLKIRV